MKPITLPTSPETRAALEKAGWRLDHGGPSSESWIIGDTWMVTVFQDGAAYVQMIGSGCVFNLSELFAAGAVLGIGAPPGYVLVPVEVAQDHKRMAELAIHEVEAELADEVSPNKPALAQAVVKRWRASADSLAAALSPTQAPPQPQPRPSEDGGLSPSPLAAMDDETAAMMSAVLDREPGFHQVNPINQRKAPVLSADPLILLEVLYNSAVNDSRLSPEVERQIRRVLGLDRVAGPGEEEAS